MAARIESAPTPSSRFLNPPPPSTSMPSSSNPSFLGRIWRSSISTALAPMNWGAAAAIEGISTRIGEIVESNEDQIVSRIRNTTNQALLRQAPPAFHAAWTAISRFLAKPHSANLAQILAQLPLVDPDQHAPLYQEVSSEGQERIRNLTVKLQSKYPTPQDRVVLDETSDQYAPLVIDESIREHLEDTLEILSTIMSHDGSLVSVVHFLNSAISEDGGLLDRIEQLLQRIETLPQRWISNALSESTVINTAISTPPSTEEVATPPPTTSEEPPFAVAGATHGSISYSTILERSSSILSQIIETASQAVSQRVASSLAVMMIFIFDKIKSHLQENQEYPHIVTIIDPLIQRISAARKNGSWRELIDSLEECKRVMQQQQVYLQGFRLPLNSVGQSSSAIPAFLTNIATHDAALHSVEDPKQSSASRQMIFEESLKLKLRASAYGPIKLINEYLLQFAPNDSLYASLVTIPPNTSLSLIDEIFKDRYFVWIDQSDCSLAFKWLAKAAYSLSVPVFNFFAEALISNAIVSYQRWQDAPKDSLNPKEIRIIQKLRNWLAILSASYNEAAETPSGQVRDFQQMLTRAIQAPERNGGLHPAELYGAFSATVLDTYGPRFNWRNSITKYYDVQIPSTSTFYFLNPLLTSLNIFCTWTINALLFIPEWIANTAMRWGTQLFLSHSPILQRNLSRTLDQLKSNTGTSYALNQVVYRQLERVWKSIQDAMPPDGEESDLQGQSSISKKLEISCLIEYLFEVLNKSRYGTQDRMRAYLEGRLSIRDRAEREIDEMFFPEALETAVSLISLSFDAVMTEEAQNELLFDMLAIANRAMDADNPVSEEECAGLEKAIRDKTDQILETSIFYALREKFDLTGKRQKAGVRQFIEELKTQSEQITEQLLSHRAHIDPFAPTNPETCGTLRNLITHSRDFQRRRLTALSRADGNRSFHTETKQKLNEISQQVVSYFTPITLHLNESLRICEETMKIDEGNRLIIAIDQALTQVQTIFSGQDIQTEDIAQSAQHIENIQRDLNQFRSLSDLFTNQQQLDSHLSQLQSTISQAQSSCHHIDILTQTIPLFERIRFLKTESLGFPTLPAEAREKASFLTARIQTLPTNFSYNHLIDQVSNLMNARTARDIAQANQEYRQRLDILIQGTRDTLQTSKASALLAAEQMKEKVASYRQLANQLINQSQNGLNEKFELLTQNVGSFNAWIQEVHDIPIWNFFVFDMQGITEITKDLAFARAKQKVNELTEALYQRHNYIGAMHHLVLLPFLEQHGPQYLRQ